MASGQSKIVVAAIVAVAGLGAAAWSITSLQRRPAPARAPREGAPQGGAHGPVGPGGPVGGGSAAGTHGALPEGQQRIVNDSGDGPRVPVDPLPQGPFEFASVESDSEFAEVGAALETGVTEGARGFAWMDITRSDHKTAGSAARLALVAPARGIDAFDSAITELRGDAAGGSAEAEMIVSLLQNAKIDTKQLRVKEATAARDGPGGGGPRQPPSPGEKPRVPMMMRVERSGDGPDDEETTLSVPVQALFPQTADEIAEGQKAIELKCPARVPGVDAEDGRVEIGVVLVRERSSGVWQPVMYNLYSRSRDAATAKAKAIRAAREKQ